MKSSTMHKVEERDKKKMDTLKKKLHTDDESEILLLFCILLYKIASCLLLGFYMYIVPLKNTSIKCIFMFS